MINVDIWAAEPLTASGLRSTIDAEQDLIVSSNAHSRATEHNPDSSRPGPSSVTVGYLSCPDDWRGQLHASASVRPTIVLITDSYLAMALRLVCDGALGVLLASERELLLPAIRTVAGNRTYLSPIAATVISDHLSGRTVREVSGQSWDLTSQECRILARLADGLSNEEIGYTLRLSVSTVKFHLSSIFTKLGVGNRLQAVALAYRCQLVNSPAGMPGRLGSKSDLQAVVAANNR